MFRLQRARPLVRGLSAVREVQNRGWGVVRGGGTKNLQILVHLLCQLAYIRSLLVPYSGVFLLEVLEDGGFAARLQVVQHVVSRK